MRSSEAKDHSVAGAASGPHPEPPPPHSPHARGSTGGVRGSTGDTAGDTGRSGGGRPDPGRLMKGPRLPQFPLDMDDLHVIDSDVSAAVGRVLEDHLAERVERAVALDPVFGHDLAERVARFTLDGGKRMRSRFVWWALRACGGGPREAEAALRVGAALELIQTGALIHDDVMDEARLRRGRPALHVDVAAQYADTVPRTLGPRFGEAAAILAGDLSLAWADDLVATVGTAPVAVRDLWSAMRTEMVAGQYLDLHGQATASRSLARAIRAACLKSALYSVERPLALGAALAGADPARSGALCAAGRRVGIAFQLRDDLTDVFGDPRRTGKPVGGDIRAGKPTYLVALAQARAETTGNRHGLSVLRRSLGRADLSDSRLEEVRDVLVMTGARAVVEAKIERLVAQGMRHLRSAPLEPEGLRRLRELLHATAGTGPATPSSAPAAPASSPGAQPGEAPPPGAPPGKASPPGAQGDGTHASLLLTAGAEGAVR